MLIAKQKLKVLLKQTLKREPHRVLKTSRMYKMRTIAIDDLVARASVSQSVTRATVLNYSPGGAT